MKAYLAEFIGTGVLVLLGDGVVAGVLLARSKAANGGWLLIVVGWGLAVAVAAYLVGTISGAQINPAVTLGLATIGSFAWDEVPGYIVAQLLGGFVGALLVWVVYLKHWPLTDSADDKLAVFCTAPAVRHPLANFATEAIATFMLVFGILGIAANANAISNGGEAVDLATLFSTGLGPLLVGLLVLVIGASLGGPTGYAINPARDLAPRVAHALLPIPGKRDADWGYAWVPVVGPLVGGVLGALVWDALNFGT